MNKGFTLVELLAVIIILGVLTLVTVVSVNPILKDAKKGLTDTQIDNIEEVASLYYIKYGVGLDDFELDNPRDCINVSELIETGYIENEEVTNPKTGEKILGSVKVTYNSNNYIYEYQDNACTNYDKGIICERVESTLEGNVPEGNFAAGDAYNCKVDPNKEAYKFYVLTTPDEGSDTVNLIMDRNICEDGTPTEEGKTCLVSYNSTGDAAGTGPVTAMTYLNNATSTWGNIDNLDIIYDDECNNFTGFVLNGKARLPYESEVADSNGSNKYLYENLDGSEWHGSGTQPTNNISGIYGYWFFASDFGGSDLSSGVGYGGGVDGRSVHNDNHFGVRPVISVYKFQIE